jgi:hypothetical protein
MYNCASRETRGDEGGRDGNRDRQIKWNTKEKI